MKIITAVNAMVANPKMISEVMPGASSTSDELFFLFAEKYKWSISKSSSSDYVIFYYPTEHPIETLASWDDQDWAHFNEMVRYSAKELGTKEAMESFSELHRVVKERQFGIDDVLDDIIEKTDFF